MGWLADIEAVATNAPLLATRWGCDALANAQVARVLIANTRSKSSGARSTSAPAPMIPALLTTASIPPMWARAAATSASPQSGSARSATHPVAAEPMASVTSCNPSASRSVRSRRCPAAAAASCSATARPIPLAAPVMTTRMSGLSVGQIEFVHQLLPKLELLDLGRRHRPFLDEADVARHLERGDPLFDVANEFLFADP